MTANETRLRERVEARLGPLAEIKVPETVEDARELAASDRELFDALFEAGRLTKVLRPASEEGNRE